MKIGMQTWGTHGDIRPILALAEGLQSSGHQVSLAITSIGSGEYDTSISKSGVKILSVASPVIRDADEATRAMKVWLDERNTTKQTQISLRLFLQPAEAEMYKAAERLCAENDLVIGHYFHYPLQTAAEKAGRRHVSVMLVHSLIPSDTLPPPGVPDRGKLSNRIAWKAAALILNRTIKPFPDRLRTAHGLKPAKDIMRDVFASHELTLIGISPQICRTQQDWPDYCKVCGFLDMPNLSMEGEISAGLEQFLSQGEPPVYMTLGSVMPADAAELRVTADLMSQAAKMAGCRAVIQAPSWQESGLEPAPDIHYVKASPHTRVFPRCKAIVHHGGAGTTQSAMTAGKPSVVVALGSDQQSWGAEMHRLGVAPAPLLHRDVTAPKLARAVREALDSNGMQENARKIGAAMSRENGVETAVKLINERFNR